MNTQQSRLLLFAVFSLAILFGSEPLMKKMGWIKERPKVAARPAPKAKDEPKADAGVDTPPAEQAREGAEKAAEIAATPKVEQVDPKELILGGTSSTEENPFHIRVAIDQLGGGVQWIESTRILGEQLGADKRREPLLLIRPDLSEPSSFSLGVSVSDDKTLAPDPHAAKVLMSAWEVVKGVDGQAVRAVEATAGKSGAGQEIRLKTTIQGVEVHRVYRLWPGEDTMSLTLEFHSPDADRLVAYRLQGPHDVPIEGEWYTTTFRDVPFGLAKSAGDGVADVETITSYYAVQNRENPYRYTEIPVRFVGVEDQYFAVLMLTPSRADSEKWIAEARSVVVSEDTKDKNRSDVTADLLSKKLIVGPNRVESHTYTIFAGPKTSHALPPVAAELAKYRKGMWVLGPMAAVVASWVITPLLEQIHHLTAFVGGLFGLGGNWGIAIILLTMTVRLAMFPISRKQAISAKKMQDLQPQISEIREKYKGDNERIMKEQMALQKAHGINLFGGCLPALLQMPIFFGLWQALNNNAGLRHAPFLWMKDLAAPDMLFKFPFDMTQVPWIGSFLGPYFNVLPLVVAGLMLVSTKLFAPPPTTPEAETQQSMMKYMMIFMVFMFYKVPSGLGLYFITSSTWQICERLLLPKILPAKAFAPPAAEAGGRDGKGGDQDGKGNGQGRDPKPQSPKGGWLAKRLEKLLEEAAKDPTVRNRLETLDKARGKETPRENEGGGGGKSRPRPGKRR